MTSGLVILHRTYQHLHPGIFACVLASVSPLLSLLFLWLDEANVLTFWLVYRVLKKTNIFWNWGICNILNILLKKQLLSSHISMFPVTWNSRCFLWPSYLRGKTLNRKGRTSNRKNITFNVTTVLFRIKFLKLSNIWYFNLSPFEFFKKTTSIRLLDSLPTFPRFPRQF